ncbi:DUF551 domain-containing protein [Salmonella enterica]|nr:DUF551 domain-containing protein [Salmonella enterica]EFR0413429.1 DUF551 domain-containing protein [Salmonella enterica]EGT9163049.1 DUF551 domain-containing protein [Salmonella enterica]
MSTITRERLLKIQQWRETYGAGSNVMLPAEEAEELARIALASLEAEPIGYMNRFTGRVFSLDEQPGADTDTAVYEPVYAAPPAPVVPDGYALVPVEPTDEMIAAAMNCEDVLFNSDESFCVQFGNIYEAMLAAAPKPQNAPQNIPAGKSTVTPDGWISCSERMPDNDESKPIAIFTGKCLGQGMFVATYDDDGFFDYWEGMEIIGVTHWMPLPAPPQQ